MATSASAMPGATAASVPQVSLNTYAGAGFPQITKVVGGTDKVTVTILNSHVSANLTAAAVLNVTLD